MSSSTGSLLFPPLLLETLEKAFNRLVSFVPEYRKAFAPVSGRTMQINVLGLGRSFVLVPGPAGIQLVDELPVVPADIQITGTPFALLSHILPKESFLTSFAGEGVTIDGDGRLAHEFEHAFSALDIDLEAILKRTLGASSLLDNVFSLFRAGRDWKQEVLNNFQLDLEEYLQQEISMAVPPQYADRFCDQVDQLRNAVDRLEKRIAAQEQKTTRNN